MNHNEEYSIPLDLEQTNKQNKTKAVGAISILCLMVQVSNEPPRMSSPLLNDRKLRSREQKFSK